MLLLLSLPLSTVLALVLVRVESRAVISAAVKAFDVASDDSLCNFPMECVRKRHLATESD